MNNMNDGGAAFPNVPDGAGDKWADWDKGMSLRDYFAAKALAGRLASEQPWRDFGFKPVDGLSIVENEAVLSYQLADAMLKARNA